MSDPVDLANLREMTDGDKELEAALFREFYTSGEKCIATMAVSCAGGDNEAWRATAHAFKGTSMNLGAAALGQLCKKAQEEFEQSPAEKTALLAQIRTAFETASKFLMAL